MLNYDSPNAAPTFPRTGMTFAEFRAVKSGVLPDTILYDGGVALPEKLYHIEGQWGFDFRDGLLYRLVFSGSPNVYSAASFQAWLSGAKNVVAEFTRSLGSPKSLVQGEERYFEESQGRAGLPSSKRHVYQEAHWTIANTEVVIVCHLKSNLEEGEQPREDSGEYWNYNFEIDVSSYEDHVADSPSIYGRYYLGMPFGIFAERHPELFPDGTAPTGQWMLKEDWHGLQGEWGYIFITGKLSQFQYNVYYQGAEATQSSYQTCRTAMLAIVEELKTRYGKPAKFGDLGSNGFNIKPRDKNTYQDFVTAEWPNIQGMRIVAEFNRFYGEDNQALIVNIQFTDRVYAGEG